MKTLLKEHEDESNCDHLYKSNILFGADIGRQETTMNFEEELKFLEAWLETPCLYEINTEIARINGEDIIANVQMIDTGNSEKENSPIHPAIILRRMRTRIQVFLHRGRNEAKIHHYLMAKKVKMKPHPQMNKHGSHAKKTKMKTLLPSFFYVFFFFFTIVSLAETRPVGVCYHMLLFSALSPLRGSVGINGEIHS